MFLYEKKIVYLSLYQDGIRSASAGFMRISREKDACILDIHVKSTGLWEGQYGLFLTARSRQIEWGTIDVQNGSGNVRKYIPIRDEFARFGEEEFAEDDLCGVLIFLGEGRWVSGYWQDAGNADQPMKEPDLVAANEEEEKRETVNDIGAKEKTVDLERADPGEILYVHTVEDKWEQLQRCYKKMHPFGDERLFLAIEPKDFVVLQAPYHRLVNNSFLLHGFYNFRHMILGPDREIGGGDGSCFYLGVPGTYFEREKMVAIMFGFEGFECNGAVEIGKFGYYMRRVEL